MKTYTGKIFSLLFLFNLFFLQGVNIAEAQDSPAVQVSSTQKHLTAAEDFSGTVSILGEAGELDDDHKLISKVSRLDEINQPAKFFFGIVSFSFPRIAAPLVSMNNSAAFMWQGVSLSQAHCSFLI